MNGPFSFSGSHKKAFLFTVLLILLVFPLMAAAPAQDGQPPDYTNLTAVLVWLAGVGGPYFVGWLLSLLAENWPTWHTLPVPVKFLTPLIASAVVAILATVALQNTQLIEIASPWYTIIAGSVMSYLGTQQAYMAARRADYGMRAKYPGLNPDDMLGKPLWAEAKDDEQRVG